MRERRERESAGGMGGKGTKDLLGEGGRWAMRLGEDRGRGSEDEDPAPCPPFFRLQLPAALGVVMMIFRYIAL